VTNHLLLSRIDRKPHAGICFGRYGEWATLSVADERPSWEGGVVGEFTMPSVRGLKRLDTCCAPVQLVRWGDDAIARLGFLYHSTCKSAHISLKQHT